MKTNSNLTKHIKITAVILCYILLLVSIIVYYSAEWYINVYGKTGFDSVIYTLTNSIGTAEKGLFISYFTNAFIPAILIYSIFCSLYLIKNKSRGLFLYFYKFRIKLFPISKLFSSIVSVILSLVLLFTSLSQVGAIEYIKNLKTTNFIEYNYVDPSDVKITFPKEKRNLIYIYLESMETTFFSEDLGGGISATAIPELYELAANNINFSDTESVGGFFPITGTGWTIAGIFSSTSGVPFKVPPESDGNDYGKDSFMPGITVLSDILHENGYYQTLMVGSDASFGGRKEYYEQHGADHVYDLFTAREDGIIPKDYYVWWGYEDKYLFEYAKQELSKISQKDQPFAFTMLTVDTHHIGGYICEYCENKYPNQYENVYACSSKQVNAFVNWIKEQDFYENTTIIITGDHCSMDAGYISNNMKDGYARKVYNCFINSAVTTENTKNRLFCHYDIFPTVLGALGCNIKGERLGLGTNLFSNKETLCEKYGYAQFNSLAANESKFYNKEFLQIE